MSKLSSARLITGPETDIAQEEQTYCMSKDRSARK